MPSMYIFKNGKDDLIVSTFEIVFDIIGSAPAKQIRFTCTGPPAARGNLPGFRVSLIILNLLKCHNVELFNIYISVDWRLQEERVWLQGRLDQLLPNRVRSPAKEKRRSLWMKCT